MRHDELLFQEGDLRLTMEHHGQGVVREIESIPEAHLLQADEDEWVKALAERYHVNAPELGDPWMDEPQSAQVVVSWDHFRRAIFDPSQPTYVPGHRTVAHIPFTGDANMFKLKPSSWDRNPPRAELGPGELRVVVEYPDDTPLNIQVQTQGVISAVERYLAAARGDIGQFNSGLEQKARTAIRNRRARVQTHLQHVAATGLPIGPPGTASKRSIAEVITRRPAPILPTTPPGQPIALVPVLADEVFEHILGVIRLHGLGMERSPKTYAHMGEEDRRQVMLDALNTHYRGAGTAEAFNFGGKTDMLIRHEGRNLFIAECKFWSGAQGFTSTVDQLFRYTSWRDTKLSIIMFVREKDLNTIIDRARAALEQHPQFVEWKASVSETELRATVAWKGDDQRRADLNVFFISTPA